MSERTQILDSLALAERLEAVLRHSWLSSGRQESVADHSFQMALMALLVHPHLAHPSTSARLRPERPPGAETPARARDSIVQ